MKRTYWEDMASSYDDQIFDVLENDKKGLIRAAIKRYSSQSKSAIDVGCAIGKWLPVLSPLFKRVFAVDISEKNLELAKEKNQQFKNITYQRVDMSGKKVTLPSCDFGICINAILTPVKKDRHKFFDALSSCINKKGRVVITVPSLESWLLSSIVQHHWKIDQKENAPIKKGKEALKKWNNIRKGVTDIDGVPHKHFLKEELQLILSQHGFAAETFEKIEYDWTTEFNRPPKILIQPRPWDWMVVAKKI